MSVLEPPEGIPGDDERTVLASFIESMVEAASVYGLYSIGSRGQRIKLDEVSPPRVFVNMRFSVGEEAWSDRVQNPELHGDTALLEGIETATWKSEAERIRLRYEVDGKLFDSEVD